MQRETGVFFKTETCW